MTRHELREIGHNVWDRHCDERDMTDFAFLGFNEKTKQIYAFKIGIDPLFDRVYTEFLGGHGENIEESSKWDESEDEEIVNFRKIQ